VIISCFADYDVNKIEITTLYVAKTFFMLNWQDELCDILYNVLCLK